MRETVKGICPNCQAGILVNPNEDLGVCPNCMKPYETSETGVTNVVAFVDTQTEVIRNAELLLVAMDYRNAEYAYRRIVEQYPLDFRGWVGLARAITCDYSDYSQGRAYRNYMRQALSLAKPHETIQFEDDHVSYLKKLDRFESNQYEAGMMGTSRRTSTFQWNALCAILGIAFVAVTMAMSFKDVIEVNLIATEEGALSFLTEGASYNVFKLGVSEFYAVATGDSVKIALTDMDISDVVLPIAITFAAFWAIWITFIIILFFKARNQSQNTFRAVVGIQITNMIITCCLFAAFLYTKSMMINTICTELGISSQDFDVALELLGIRLDVLSSTQPLILVNIFFLVFVILISMFRPKTRHEHRMLEDDK